jgi:hypothetical protein
MVHHLGIHCSTEGVQGYDTILEAIGKGSIKARMQVGRRVLFITITQVLHVPKMKNSLISVNKLISEGLKVEFDKDGYKVNNAHGIVVAEAQREKNLYFFNVNVQKESANVAKFSNEGATFWHQRQHNMASLTNGQWHEFERSVIATCV